MEASKENQVCEAPEQERANFEYKKTLIGTLRKLSLGEHIVIQNRDFKSAQVRIAASLLKRREQYEFKVSEAGRIDNVIVTRIK
jgi:hypothetical protein